MKAGESCTLCTHFNGSHRLQISLRASSPIWAREASLARTGERAAKPRGARVLARLTSLTQIGELARRLIVDYLGL